MKSYISIILLVLNWILPISKSWSQNDTLQEDLFKFTIEDIYKQTDENLLNINISIASKRQEKLFDAPFSVSVITKEDIKKAGSTTIMEAFRLIPGLIVVEQTNGNYDIYLRGGSNVQRNTIFSRSGNTTTLVMIDNRPIYNYYQGGAFWETIPIDLNDVERIELIRGASSAMYGPNAASGVINIITRRTQEKGLYMLANAQQGSLNTTISNTSIGYQFSPRFSAILSANAQSRERSQNTYFNYPTNTYVERDDLTGFANPTVSFPDISTAMRKYGINAFINYKPTDKSKVDITMGWQDSKVQKVYSENITTPLNFSLSETFYTDINVGFGKFSGQFSYQEGKQTEGLDNFVGLKWDFYTLDGILEYEFNIKTLSIKPGLNYRKAVYDDSPYYDASQRAGFLNGKRSIDTYAGYLRADYGLFENKIRLVAATRVDKFNFPNDLYFSYQFGVNWKPSEKHLVRVVAARANRSSSVVDIHVDRLLPPFANERLYVGGNKDIQLLLSDMLELGYRTNLSSRIQLDVEAFLNNVRNYSDFINTASFPSPGEPGIVIEPQFTTNTPLKTRQYGITISLNYATSTVQFKPFISFQNTTLLNSSLYPYTSDAPNAAGNNNNPALFNLNSGLGTSIEHEGTPQWYGGFYLNYIPNKQWNFNMTGYYFGSQKFYYFMNTFVNDGISGIGEVNSKILLNTKISYKPITTFSIFMNLRNFLNQNTNEFFNTDKVGILLLGGISFEY